MATIFKTRSAVPGEPRLSDAAIASLLAEQYAADQAAVNAEKAGILTTTTVLAVTGTFDLAANDAEVAAAQLATDRGVVLAAAASIKNDVTILGQAGTYDFAAAIAAGYAAGEVAQKATDSAFLETNKDEIVTTAADILAEFGVEGTAADGAGGVYPAAANVLDTETAYGPTGADYAGQYHAPTAAQVKDGVAFGVADEGEYSPGGTFAEGQAAQYAVDRAEVSAKAAYLLATQVICGISGTLVVAAPVAVSDNLFARGRDMLAGKQKTHASVSIVYRRGGASVALYATVGKTAAEYTDGYGATITDQARDYLILAADLVLGDARTLPLSGDTIEETDGDQVFTYEVTAMGPEPCYRYSDAGRVRLRIHTKLSTTVDA